MAGAKGISLTRASGEEPAGTGSPGAGGVSVLGHRLDGTANLAANTSQHLIRLHLSARGSLGRDVLLRIREHVVSRLNKPIEVAELAGIAGRSPFHFSRVFTRSVGVTPHRYVVHLRLQRAVELLHQRELSPAQIAARTGFADQSHLSRWVRRVYGVSIRQLFHTQDTRGGKVGDRQRRNLKADGR